MAGWIKLHRSIDEWAWRKSPDTLSVWLYLLTNARHEAGSWKGIDLDAGQLIIGRKALSEKTGVSERASRTAIERLKSANAITTKTTNKYTLVTIVNWAFYQQDSEKTTSKTTSKMTNKRPANDQQTTTNKNEKNERIKEPPPPTPSGGKEPNGGGSGGDFDGIPLPDGNRQELNDFLSSGLTMELVHHAANEAAAHNSSNWAYVRSILNRYKREGITSIEQARQSDGRPAAGNASAGLNPWVLTPEEESRKRREEARTLARLRGELPK